MAGVRNFDLYFTGPIAAVAFITIAGYFLVGLAEITSRILRRRRVAWRDIYISLFSVALDLPVAILTGHRWGRELGPRGLDFTVNGYQIFFGRDAFSWYQVFVAFVFADLWFYVTHRLYHGSNLFWIYHSTHHSAPELHFLLGIRTGVFRYATIAAWSLLAGRLPDLLGVSPSMFGVATGFVFFYQSLLHWDGFPRLGLVDRVLITPSNHRVHHAINLGPSRNLGGVTLLWDHIFGTFLAEPEIPLIYGIGAPASEVYRPVAIQFYACKMFLRSFVRAKSFRSRMSALFYH